MKISNPQKRFLVSFSFAGEKRNYVKQVAESLRLSISKDKIFYDNYYASELARPNLDTYLCNIYKDDSELLVIFLNEDYTKKEWCGLEWRVVREIIKKKNDGDIMLIRFDSAEIDGLLSIDGFLDINNMLPAEVAELILERLMQSGKLEKGIHNPVSINKPKLPIRIVHGLPPAPRFVGRENELDQLRSFWNNSSSRIFGIEAIGGSGKTALSEYFLSEIIAKNESDGIFVWSFYDNSNPEFFFQELYKWLQPTSNADIKGYAWLNIVKEEFCNKGKLLLILDGLEKIQFQIDSYYNHTYGSLQDNLIKDFLKRVAAFGGETKTIITTRFPLPDLESWKGRTYSGIILDELDVESGIALLKSHGIRGTEQEFKEALYNFGAHALTIDHLGSVIKLFYNGDIKSYREIEDLCSFENIPKAKKLQAIFGAYEKNLPELEKKIIGIVSLYRLGVDLPLIEQTYQTMYKKTIKELNIKLAIQNLISSHLLLFDNKYCYTVHPAVRDYFYHIFKDPLKSHTSASQTLISLTNRPGGDKIVTDQLLLDQLEELVYHLIKAGSINMAKDIYFSRIGSAMNLGYNLGDFSRLKRLLDEFPTVIDYDGVMEYQRALGLLPDIEKIEAIKPKLSAFVAHRFDSILLLLGELPRAVSREVSSAKYLMGYNCYVYPTYEAAPKFQAYCLRGEFPEHLGFSMLKKITKEIQKVPLDRNPRVYLYENNKSYIINYQVVNQDEKYYYVEVEREQRATFENFGNDSVKLLFEAELLRINNNHNSAWQKLKSAEARVVQSGSIEHLCLLHLIKAKLHLDKDEVANSEYEIFEGLELSTSARYRILKIDFLNEQARLYLSKNAPNKFIETIKSAIDLSTDSSCKYFWGALKAADLMIEAANIYSKREEGYLKEALSVFKEIFETQKHNSIEFNKMKSLMGFK